MKKALESNHFLETSVAVATLADDDTQAGALKMLYKAS